MCSRCDIVMEESLALAQILNFTDLLILPGLVSPVFVMHMKWISCRMTVVVKHLSPYVTWDWYSANLLEYLIDTESLHVLSFLQFQSMAMVCHTPWYKNPTLRSRWSSLESWIYRVFRFILYTDNYEKPHLMLYWVMLYCKLFNWAGI